jgi:transposase InsO family protein
LTGFSRQAYYRGTKARVRRDVDEEAIVELVQEQRRLHPRMGARKVRHVLEPLLRELGICIGRDRFFSLLRRRDLLVERRRRGVRTTDSRHGFRTWPNRIRFIVPAMANQVWVSDLTYLRTEEGFLYLSLITDAFSRKVVGYFANDTLEADGCRRALQMALAGLPAGAAPIHHSDRGTQYCCAQYVELLTQRGCLISMTEMNHCYENAKAERVNGILKDEYGLGETFHTKAQARAAARQAVELYNGLRPHTALAWKTPAEVHAEAA